MYISKGPIYFSSSCSVSCCSLCILFLMLLQPLFLHLLMLQALFLLLLLLLLLLLVPVLLLHPAGLPPAQQHSLPGIYLHTKIFPQTFTQNTSIILIGKDDNTVRLRSKQGQFILVAILSPTSQATLPVLSDLPGVDGDHSLSET